METEYPNESSIPSEVPSENISNEGVSSIQGVSSETETHLLPRPDNPETLEASKSPDAVPGKDDGLTSLTTSSSAKDDSTTVTDGRRRIQQTLDQPIETIASSEKIEAVSPPLSPTGMSAMQGTASTNDSPSQVANTSSDIQPQDNIDLPPVSPSVSGHSPNDSIVTDIQTPTEKVDSSLASTLPDGSSALISGNPEALAQYTHQQGQNELGYQQDCGLVACEGILRQAGKPISENDVVQLATKSDLCDTTQFPPSNNGGTSPEQQAKILSEYGVPATVVNATSLNELSQYIEAGQGAIAEVNAGVLWNNADYLQDGNINHAITVTGVAKDSQNGSTLGYFINDSGAGDAGKFIPASRMERAWLNRGGWLVLTNKPI